MSVPRRRLSKSRTSRRKAGKKTIANITTSNCTECGRARMPHRACMACGFYKIGINVKVS